MNKYVLSLALLFAAFAKTAAQAGLEAGLMQTRLAEWATFADEAAGTPFAGPAAGRYLTVSYWFRLRPVRIEFSPGIQWSRQQFRLSPNDEAELAIQSAGVEWPIMVYPFDLGSDCDCPTFSKQGPALEKGLFLALVPAWHWQQYLPPDGSGLPKGSQMLPSLAVRAGLDIGLSDAWTLTLQGGLRMSRAWAWDDFPALFPDQPEAPTTTRADGWQAGVVMRYRWRR